MFSWNSLAFSMIQWMLAIWSLVPLPFLNPAWTSGSLLFMVLLGLEKLRITHASPSEAITILLLSPQIRVASSRVSYKQNYSTHTFLCLTSFTHHRFSAIHLRGLLVYIAKYCSITIICLSMHLLIDIGLLLALGYSEHSCTCLFVDRFFISFGQIPLSLMTRSQGRLRL